MQLIFIYGTAAVGKLTVARELSKLTGFSLFHNHLIVDAVSSVFSFGTEPFVKLREDFWLKVFEEAAQARRSLIFTFARETTVDPGFPKRAQDLVRAAGGQLHFVRLNVSYDEQERRLSSPERAKFEKLKSVELLRKLRDGFDACLEAMPQPALTIDTEVVQPVQAAREIASKLGLTSPTRP